MMFHIALRAMALNYEVGVPLGAQAIGIITNFAKNIYAASPPDVRKRYALPEGQIIIGLRHWAMPSE